MPQGIKLPTGMSPEAALMALVKGSASADLSSQVLSISAPIEIEETPDGANTAVTISVSSPEYSGDVELFYTRRELSDILIDVEPAPLQLVGFQGTRDLLPQINAQTGLVMSIADIADGGLEPVGVAVVIQASQESYFFVPGSTVEYPAAVEPPREFTRFKLASNRPQGQGFMFSPTPAVGQVSYSVDGGPWLDVAEAGIPGVIYVTPDKMQLDVRNNLDLPLGAQFSSGYPIIGVEEIEWIQSTHVPTLNFPKTEVFQAISNHLPAIVTSLDGLFDGATTFNQDLSSWDVSNVTSMVNTFRNASAYNQDLSSWDVSAVTSSAGFDTGATAWVQPKPPFPVVREFTRFKIRSGGAAFRGLVFGPTGLSEGQISWRSNEGAWNNLSPSGLNANHIYMNPNTVYLDIRNNSGAPIPAITPAGYGLIEVEGIDWFQTTQVPVVNFKKTPYFTYVAENPPAALTNMSDLFFGATAFNQDIGHWDTSNVTDMRRMFRETSQFNQDIGGWDTSNVLYMEDMFHTAVAFNQDIGGWRVGNVVNDTTGMRGMFYSSTTFNQDLSNWCVSNHGWEPASFRGNNPNWITTGRLPVWGTCPLGS